MQFIYKILKCSVKNNLIFDKIFAKFLIREVFFNIWMKRGNA